MPRYIVTCLLMGLSFAALQVSAIAGDTPEAPPEPAATAGAESAPASSAGDAREEGKAHCTLSVPGMHCGGCAKQVAKKAGSVEGVAKVDVRLDDHEVDVSYDPAKTSPEKLREIVSKLYEATIKQPASGEAAEEKATPTAPAEDTALPVEAAPAS